MNYEKGAMLYKVFEESECENVQAEFHKTLSELPEFKPSSRERDIETLGGFGAIGGNPSVYHHPFFRKLRSKITYEFIQQIAIPLVKHLELPNNTKIQTLFDRPAKRHKSQKAQAEGFHRDVAPKSCISEDDIIMGGWCNIGPDIQSFTYVPQTHLDATLYDVSHNPGFHKITNKEYIQQLNQMKETIHIPVGYAIAFPQHIIHTVVGTPAKCTSLRQFIGFRFTTSDISLFDQDEIIQNQGVPFLPSGQTPRIYSQNHGSCFIEKQFNPIPNDKEYKVNLIEWSRERFLPQLLHTYSRKTGKRKGETYTVIPPTLKSLKELNLPLYPPYSQSEKDILLPRNIIQ